MKGKSGVGTVTIDIGRAAKRLDPVGARIIGAFGGESHPSWRTKGGIARSTGLSEHTVEGYIDEHPTYFTIGPVRPAGESLYAPSRELFDTLKIAGE